MDMASSSSVLAAFSASSEKDRRQSQLLCYFALADLLELTPTWCQQLSTAVTGGRRSFSTAPASSSSVAAAASSATCRGGTPASHSKCGEDGTGRAGDNAVSAAAAAPGDSAMSLLLAAVVKHIVERAQGIDSPVDGDASPILTGAAAMAAPGIPPVRTRKRRPPSILSALPWEAAPPAIVAAAKASTAPCMSDRADPPALGLLPAVLASPQGLARVDALCPSFIPQLLEALVLRLGEDPGEMCATDGSAAGTSAPPPTSAMDMRRARRGWQEALQNLLYRYVPLHLRWRRRLCEAVLSLLKTLQASSSQDRADVRAAGEDVFTEDMRAWLEATRRFSFFLATYAAAVDRRASALPPPASLTSGVEAGEEAAWMLCMIGCWLGATDQGHRRKAGAGSPASSAPSKTWEERPGCVGSEWEATPRRVCPESLTEFELLGLAEVACEIHAEARNGVPEGTYHCASEAPPSSLEVLGDVALWCVGLGRESAARDGSAVLGTPAPSPFPPLTEPISQPPWHTPCLSHVRRFHERQEYEQRSQHRLLAAAKRWSQRLLRQERLRSTLWDSPAVPLAVCGVAAYQLRTQLRRRGQRLSELQRDTDAVPAAPFMVKATESDDGNGSATAVPKRVGQWRLLWSGDTVAQEGEGQGEEDEGEGGSGDAASPTGSVSSGSQGDSAESAPAMAAWPGRLPPARTIEPDETAISPLTPPHVRPFSPSATPPGARLPQRLSQDNGSRSPADDGSDRSVAASFSVEDQVTTCHPHGNAYAPARSMELLWELSTRAPQEWTAALATVMACCVLCLPPSRESLRLCSVGKPEASKVSGTPHAAQTSSQRAASVSWNTHASLQPSLLEQAPPCRMATAEPSATSERSSVCGRNPTTAAYPLNPSAGEESDDAPAASVLGAVAQWHLRELIWELRVPACGCLPPAAVWNTAGTCGGSTSHAAPPASAWTAPGDSRPSRRATPIALSTAASTATTTTEGGDGSTLWLSWFSRPVHASVGGHGDSSGAVPAPVQTSLQPDPVAVLASAFALLHLLQGHSRFYGGARLGGRTLRELRLAVQEARWNSGEAGCMTEMLQCHSASSCASAAAPEASTISLPNMFGAGVKDASGDSDRQHSRQGPYGTPWRRVEALHISRGRSLWGSAFAVASAQRLSTLDMDEWVSEEERRLGSDDAGADGASRNGSAEEKGDTTGATCSLVEAVLVATSYLGSRVVAVALPLLLPRRSSTSLSFPLRVETAEIGSAEPAVSTVINYHDPPWCDALQWIAALLREVYRVHRSGSATRPGGTTPFHSCGHSCTMETAAEAPVTSTATPATFSLSVEGQFGLGAFFLALVRAVLQLHYATEAYGPDPAPTASPVLLCVVQCLYAVASIIDDVLHHYASGTPIVLCDTLAMMMVLQLPIKEQRSPGGAALRSGGPVAAASAGVDSSAAPTAWDALRHSPYWEASLLGSLEDVSRLWYYAGDGGGAANAPRGSTAKAQKEQHSSRDRRSAASTILGLGANNPSAFACQPPWQSLLGYLRCSRDRVFTSWLPAFAIPQRHSLNPNGLSDARTPLESLAAEELLCNGCPISVLRTADRVADTSGQEAEDGRQAHLLAVSLLGTSRYATWISRLYEAWKADWAESLSECTG